MTRDAYPRDSPLPEMGIGQRDTFFVPVMSLGNQQIPQFWAAKVSASVKNVSVEEFGSQLCRNP